MSFLSQPLQSIFIKPKRMIGAIEVQVVVNESTANTLTITKQPVQQGASITDHAYMEPTGFSCSLYFHDNLSVSLSKLYQNLQDLQTSRVPFDIVTPKRTYKNMLMASLSMTTDKATENCLSVAMSFQEIIIVTVTTTTIPRQKQKKPASTGATQKAGNKSMLVLGKEAFQGVLGTALK